MTRRRIGEIRMRGLVAALFVTFSCAQDHNGGSGAGGTTGTAGTGGTGGGAGDPCAGLCGNPRSVPPATNSADLGTDATCDEVIGGNVAEVICGNFQPPRTFSVNGMNIDCLGAHLLPAQRNGGWCMQASAGDYSYAYFATF
jgi:hypothetical protein